MDATFSSRRKAEFGVVPIFLEPLGIVMDVKVKIGPLIYLKEQAYVDIL